MAKGRVKKRVAKAVNKLADRLEKDAKDIGSIEIPDAIDEAIHDDIQNGKIEAAMAAAEPEPAPEPAPAPKPKAAPAPKATTSRVLKRGSTGPDVAAIQQALGVVEDGFSFGTQVAVQNFQRRAGLPVTGIVDAETQAKILE